MERVTGVFVTICSLVMIQSLPINNGFSVKFNPINLNEEVKQKAFGALFAKIPQTLTSDSEARRQMITKAYYPNPPDLGKGCTNQVAKIVFPVKSSTGDANDEQTSENVNFINLPIVNQAFENYKILVATAPANVKMSSDDDSKPLIVYIVFPEDGNDEETSINIPSIYFVTQSHGKMDVAKKMKAEPILVIDSNRTVTGLKSKEIEKFVKFRNKLTNRYNYRISR